jgi:hypothetical protein
VEAVRVLCARGADETEEDVEGFTALHWAAAMGDPACIRALVQVGANVEARDRHDTTPLHSAAGKGQVRTAAWLMRVARAASDASAAEEWESCRGVISRHIGCDIRQWWRSQCKAAQQVVCPSVEFSRRRPQPRRAKRAVGVRGAGSGRM